MAATDSSAMAQRMVLSSPVAARPDDRPTPGDKRRGLQTARCSLCGIELPLALMVPDGGDACADLRWYCKDSKSCTDRWTARPNRP